ncbi:E3 ubiquitin-protein ligase makorin-2-like [Anopheles nili]|uniref:E3 ubiquitin-protein ligase makorin-2-like n=1 Tax=Anopheles nili TaxID=185578 RepID=UPI00237B1047|nr:E3 ubiquitin-protein ligase makorin-2-like [Anopheles nili]
MELGKATPVAPLDNATAAQIVCRFYRLGVCRFGNACRFIHPNASPGDETGGSSHGSNPLDDDGDDGGGGGGGCELVRVKDPINDMAPGLEPSVFDLSKCVNAPVFVPQSRLVDKPNIPAQFDDGMPEDEDDEADEADEAEEADEADEANEADDEEDDDQNNEANDEDGEEAGAVGHVASPLSYANVVTMNNNHNGHEGEPDPLGDRTQCFACLCSYYEIHGQCPHENCVYLHGELCELCHKYCLLPSDREQQRQHHADCIKQHEREMEHAFAVQRSTDKTCGICLEVVMEKRVREQRFGILPNCKHTFCLSCIRTWRKATNFANKIKRGCPTCRVPSDFVCPSFVWVECGAEKDQLIENYKKACNNTDCMHFKRGAASCPFGNKCFYRHALPSGELVDLGAPSRRRNLGRRNREYEERVQVIQSIVDALLMSSVHSDFDGDSEDEANLFMHEYGLHIEYSTDGSDDNLF